MNQFQVRLKELKERSGKTQARIAEELGITPQAFSYYVNGREPDYDILIKMAEYFNVSTDYLLGKSEVKHASYKDAYDKLGLTDDAQEYLSSLKQRQKIGNIYLFLLNAIISDPELENLMLDIILYHFPSSYKPVATANISDFSTNIGPLPKFELTDELIKSSLKFVIQNEFIEIVNRSLNKFDSEFITEE